MTESLKKAKQRAAATDADRTKVDPGKSFAAPPDGDAAEPAGSNPAVAHLDFNDPKSNMYGCLPCPKCKGVNRFPTTIADPDDPMKIICECGYKEPYA